MITKARNDTEKLSYGNIFYNDIKSKDQLHYIFKTKGSLLP